MAKKEEFLKEHEYLYEKEVSRSDFPPDFLFGVATSAYQIEGASNEGGRGPCIWDAFAQSKGNILDGSNGDVAVDHYNRYKEDIEIIAKLGFDAYRFSISWSRIFPDGLGTKVNDEGIAFYNNVINALLEKDTCFASFGDRVKHWITLNEPLQTAINGHDTGIFAPGRHEQSSTEPYLASHHQILAHAAAVSIYRSKYQTLINVVKEGSCSSQAFVLPQQLTNELVKKKEFDKQGGQIGMVVDCEWAEASSNKIEDKIATVRRLEFQLGWYLNPLYYGDYPEVMHEILGERLPKFTEEDKELLRNSIDFVGLNHYTSRFISHATESPEGAYYYKAQSMERRAEFEGGEPIGEKAASDWLYVCPWGLRKVLNYIAQKYKNPPIYVTENGMDDEDVDAPLHEVLDDKLRVRYFKGYLASVAQAIKKNKMSTGGEKGSATTKTPADFLKSIRGRPVVVKLNSGVDYRGILACLDGYMNIAMEQTEEYVNGQLKNKYGDAFIRGNNVLYISTSKRTLADGA
ncbi:unnamed protein product [Dovyalis caffra]|nr:unnamed protein product [Dovyalis caffra]